MSLDPAWWLARQPTDHTTRDSEWISSLFMLGFAGILALPGNSFANPVFGPFRDHGFTEALCGTLLTAIGTMRLVALYVNGRSPRTPRFREIGAVAGLMVWMQLGVVVLLGSERSFGVVPPVFALYVGLTVVDLRSALRASFDVRYRR